MKEAEERIISVEEKKAHIRERYKGIDENQLSVIPALPKIDIFDRERQLRVAVYARVSTDDPNQTSSYELQKNHYTDLINHNPGWNLVDIYADEGISGTSLQHRDAFVRMISDCKSGKIDLIVTKSVSRFARNLLDGVGYVRMLGSLTPPVGVYFETENINTLNKDSEMTLAFMATMAQEESHNKSEIMNASIEMRFKRGIFLTPPLLGYDQDPEGNLIINEEEAKTVRLIFFMYLYGYSCSQIAESLTSLKRQTKKGNTKWTSNSVMQQLRNERHCGAVLARKTWTPNYLDHKSKKNRQNRNQYLQDNHHEAIISRADFIAVQHILDNAKPGGGNILPELYVIPDGALAGYVSVNPRWTGFKPKDYFSASDSVTTVTDDANTHTESSVTVYPGEIDLRDFEIVRAQFINEVKKVGVSFTANKIIFSSACLEKISGEYIEILVHPRKNNLIIRPTSRNNRYAFQWAKKKENAVVPKEIHASSIMPCLYGLFNWDIQFRYRICGVPIVNNSTTLILFNLDDAEMIIPKRSPNSSDSSQSISIDEAVKSFKTNAGTLAFPASWADSFGNDFYIHRIEEEKRKEYAQQPLILSAENTMYNPNPEIIIPNQNAIANKISTIIDSISSEET